MAWRFVKQPNGLLARFSDVVDNFTEMNMTQDEAIHYCHGRMRRHEGQRKVQAAVDDIRPFTVNTKGTGTTRWNDALETIEIVHGKEARELAVADAANNVRKR